MKYQPPSGSVDPNAPYVGRNLAAGIQGSRVPPKAVEHPQREIMALIESVGITPNEGDLTQLNQAVRRLFRTRLQANATFYVGTTGNDANDGSAGAPWKTLTKAASYVQTQLDLNGYSVTINVADGTYTAPFSLAGYVPGQTNSGQISLIGNVANPSACIVNVANNACFIASNGAAFSVRGFRVLASSSISGSGVYASTGGIIGYQSMRFGACAVAHVLAEIAGYCTASGPNSIDGSAPSHLFARDAGVIAISSTATTLTGTPGFSAAFVQAESGVVSAPGATFSGSATGPRSYANANGVIKTGGGGATFFPGSIAGGVNAGGQYL
jgi:hypothetical protein